MNEHVERANDLLRQKGYREPQLAAHETPMAGRALLKGAKIVSPFSDSPETVLAAVERCVPTADELGRRQLTPHELRECLAAGS